MIKINIPATFQSILLGSIALLTYANAQSAQICPAVLNHPFKPLMSDSNSNLCAHAGKVVLVVNTASACGYTPQYEGLEKLHKQYQNQGLVVLGFPANDFGQQESGSNQDIAKFCKINYGVSFGMATKLGQPITRDPLFADLIKASGRAPQWNFHKYLIDRSGKVLSFDSGIEPTSEKFKAAVEVALKQKVN